MKSAKFLAATLASVMLASSLALPSSAASSSYTPTSSNFVPLFDFDSTPTAQYTDGYQPGGTSDSIGDSGNEKCIDASNVNDSYNLKISKGAGYKGNALVDTVTDQAPANVSYDPIELNCGNGENKLPGCVGDETPTDFVFWVDMTGYKTTDENCTKAILLTITEADYDSDGNILNNNTEWWPKSSNEGGFFQIEDGNGGWTNESMLDASDSRSFALPSGYKGWIKIPLSNFEVNASAYSEDLDGKFDGKQILNIELGTCDFACQAGSVIVFDEFGLMTKSSSIRGDVNGDGVVNSKDVTILRRYLAGWPNITIDSAAADYNNDGVVNSKDSTLLRRYVAGWRTE